MAEAQLIPPAAEVGIAWEAAAFPGAEGAAAEGVYQKDLGPDTMKTFEVMDRFNPDKTWKPTDDQWPESKE